VKKELTIEGMACENCSQRLERIFNSIEGVQATVDLAAKKAELTLSQEIDDDMLKDVVRKAGYEVTDIK
jgi:Cu+-exporting ATPase